MLPRRLFPIPGVGSVAPLAVEIAEGEPEKDSRRAERWSLALQRVEELRGAIGHAGEFHLIKGRKS